ncbi:hypothetical protein [Kineococcus sp. SYSU DK018]|uniref:hypothetical protein n=1 Tax=Kineococcus sp. SYSU DK018 TaxID=3383139 RepID=UPI003D7D6E11
MSTEPHHEAPVPREAPSPPGAELPALVDEIEERVDAEVREVAARSRREEGAGDPSGDPSGNPSGNPSGDVVPDAAGAGAGQAADPTLREDGGDGDGDAPVSEPTG